MMPVEPNTMCSSNGNFQIAETSIMHIIKRTVRELKIISRVCLMK